MEAYANQPYETPIKQSYYCPFDNETRLVKIPRETDRLYTQYNPHIHADNHIGNPSKVYKFVKCKTSEPSVHRALPIYKNNNVFYKARDIWEFDNIGVSKPPPSVHEAEIIKVKSEDGDVHNYAVVRYLVCGACDKGVFGFGGYLTDFETLQGRAEIGFDLQSANPNDLVYFFYIWRIINEYQADCNT